MSGKIIVGYQGIGKSTLAKNGNGYIDLESGNFWIGETRFKDWYIPYCKIAYHLAEQGYTVFTSSHKVVRDYLATAPNISNIPMYIAYPSIKLKEQWIGKLRNRYATTHLDKDYKALMNAIERYEENIAELMACDNFEHIVIPSINYSLESLIERSNYERKID